MHKQIHNARNHMMAAIGELKRLQRLINNNRGKANENGLTEALRVCAYCIHFRGELKHTSPLVMQRIKDELRMAREELVINEAHQFPDNLFTPNVSIPCSVHVYSARSLNPILPLPILF